MSRLDDLYKAIETMRREHLSTADLEAKVSLGVIGTGTEVNPKSWTG